MSHISKQGISVISQNLDPNDIIIVAPLHWGLGHATRCIPLIHHLCQNYKKVVIASDGGALDILMQEFPQLSHFELPSYHIRYKYKSLVLNILIQLPKIWVAIAKEYIMAKRIAKWTGASVIISDNRMGFRSPACKNIYITHQLNIVHKSPLIAWGASLYHRYFIHKFDHCWVPDYAGMTSLAPALSQSKSIKNVSHIGPLTRINKLDIPIKYDILVLLSGPEPQRTIMEEALYRLLSTMVDYSILFVRGVKISSPLTQKVPHIHVVDLLHSEEVSHALNSSKLLLARSGYSTVMDVAELDLKAIWIPTPGQTEQEYLASILPSDLRYKSLSQDQLEKIPSIISKILG